MAAQGLNLYSFFFFLFYTKFVLKLKGDPKKRIPTLRQCTFQAPAEAAACWSLTKPDFLTWRMPFGLNMLVFFWQSYIGLRFLLFSFFLQHNILGGRWAGMRERLHFHYHHHIHNQEQQVCAWLHICGGGHVCFGSHKYFWLGTVDDGPLRLDPPEISCWTRHESSLFTRNIYYTFSLSSTEMGGV